MVDALYPSCKDSTDFKYLAESAGSTPIPPNYQPFLGFNLGESEEVETSDHVTPVPETLTELAQGKTSVDKFLQSLPSFTRHRIQAIERTTTGQSNNKQWFNFRSGLITASKIKSVITRNATLHDTSSLRSQDPEPLIKTVMGYQMVDPDIPNLKYGRLMEPDARKTYDAIQKKRHQHHETK